MIDIKNYYLNLNSINSLPSQNEKDQIHSYYMELLNSYEEKRKERCESLFNTLYNNGFLIEVRNEKIDRILS